MRKLPRVRPDFIQPQMPILVDEPPEGGDWIHEVKYDGYRTQLQFDKWDAVAFTRNGHNWTAKYQHICNAAHFLRAQSAVLDGEVIVPNEMGGSDFGALKNAFKSSPGSMVFVAFDLLMLNGKDMRHLACTERRAALWDVVAPAEGLIQFSHHVETSGAAFYKAVDGMGLEGMVSKLAESAYVGGASRSWLKTKCYTESDFEIAGVLNERGKPAMALMVDAERNYVGSAFVTLPKGIRERLWSRVEASRDVVPKGMKDKPGIQWVKPGITATVKHLKGEEVLRHASVKTVHD